MTLFLYKKEIVSRTTHGLQPTADNAFCLVEWANSAYNIGFEGIERSRIGGSI